MRSLMSKGAALCLLLSSGCLAGGDKDDATDGEKSPTVEAEPGDVCSSDPALTASDDVDILVVVDNSGSMKEEQANLALELPKLVKAISLGKLSAFDGDADEELEFPAARSVHVGVVSTDMGINGVSGIDGCSGVGDDGLLQTEASGYVVDLSLNELTPKACGELATRDGDYLSFAAEDGDIDNLARDFGCLAQLGTGGCGYEQQLEAMWKALAPKSNRSFTADSSGHGDGANKGFVRPGSMLVVLMVTDEEDCSIPDESRDIFSPFPTDPKFKPDGQPEGVNSRCALHATDGTLHPVARYIDGLKGLRQADDGRIVFAALTGVPLNAGNMLEQDGTQDFEQILALPEMQIRFKDADPVALQSASGVLPDPACESRHGKASPARRIVKTAQGFGAQGIVRSICTESFSDEVKAVTTRIAKSLQASADEREARCSK